MDILSTYVPTVVEISFAKHLFVHITFYRTASSNFSSTSGRWHLEKREDKRKTKNSNGVSLSYQVTNVLPTLSPRLWFPIVILSRTSIKTLRITRVQGVERHKKARDGPEVIWIINQHKEREGTRDGATVSSCWSRNCIFTTGLLPAGTSINMWHTRRDNKAPYRNDLWYLLQALYSKSAR